MKISRLAYAAYAFAVVVIVLDQLTKAWIISGLSLQEVGRIPILPPDRIRRLPFGTGITLLRSAPPIVTDLRAWPTRPDAAQLRSDRNELEALLRHRPAS